MYKNIKVEAENLELILENSHGDKVIIPANKRNWVKQKLSEGCHGCIDSLVETLPVASQYAQDGTVYPNGTKVKVNQNNQIKEYDISSPEYKDLYNSGKLTNYDKNTDTYIATPLKEVEITAEAPQWLKDKRKYESQYTKDWYIDNNMPKFSRSMGVSSDNMHPNNVKEYDNYINNKVVEDIFKRKPTFDTDYSDDRLKTLQGFSQKELELIKNSKYSSKIEPSIWSKFEQGLLSVGNVGSPVQFKNPSLTQEEAKKEDNPLNILQPLSIPSKMVQSTYKDNYSFKDALKGKQNNANIGEDVITDPLNLIGLGIWDKLSKAGKFTKLDDAYQTVKGLSKEEALNKLNSTDKPFENRIWDNNMQLGNPKITSHISDKNYTYRTLGQSEIDDILETGTVNPRVGKQKGGNKNVKYWTKGNGKNWYDKDVIRIKNENLLPNEKAKLEHIEFLNPNSNEFESLSNKLSNESRHEHSLKNNPNLSWRDEGDGLLKPYNTKTGKLLQEEYVDNIKNYYDSPEFKRIMEEHYPDVDINTYKQKTLENLKNPITYNPNEVGTNLGVYKTKHSTDAVYMPGYKPTLKQRVNNANTNKYNSGDRGRSYLKVFDATDHELSHQRTNADELLPDFLTDDFLRKNVKKEIQDELDVVKDLGENSIQFDNFKYQTKPTEFEVRLRQLKEDLKSNNINDYFNNPVTEEHINTLLNPELQQSAKEGELFTEFNKKYRAAKNADKSEKELQLLKDNYFKELDNIQVKQNKISGDTRDLLKYYSPKFLAEMSNKLPAILPFALYLQSQQNKSKQ